MWLPKTTLTHTIVHSPGQHAASNPVDHTTYVPHTCTHTRTHSLLFAPVLRRVHSIESELAILSDVSVKREQAKSKSAPPHRAAYVYRVAGH